MVRVRKLRFKLISIFLSLLLAFPKSVFVLFILGKVDFAIASGSCGDPICYIPKELQGLPVQPEYDPSIGYCAYVPVAGIGCVSPYIFSGVHSRCISYPRCEGLCFWDTNTNSCKDVNVLPVGGDTGIDFTGKAICGRDLNNDGDLSLNEIKECVNATFNGTQYTLCPVDLVECNQLAFNGTCPSGTTLEKETGFCISEAQIICPQGFSYDQGIGKCVSSPQCLSNGILNPVTDKCEIVLDSSFCPDGYIYDSSLQVCVKDVSCSSGGIYNPFTDRCELSVTYTCPYGASYDSQSNKCYVSFNCPSGFSYNNSVKKCVKSAIAVCPSGFSYNQSSQKCEVSPSCPSGGTYNAVTNRCEAGALSLCPSGTTYNSSTGKCESSPAINCPAGTYFDSGLGKCVSSPGGSNGPYVSCSITPVSLDQAEVIQIYSGSRGSGWGGLSGRFSCSCECPPPNVCSCRFESSGRGRKVFQKYTSSIGMLGVSICECNPGTLGCPSGTTYDPGLNLCVADAGISCPSNTVYNPNTRKCEVAVQLQCSSGYVLQNNICVANAICPSGSSLNTERDVCETSVVYQCSEGTYDSVIGMCVLDPICTAGFSFNSQTERCESSPVSVCPTGYVVGGNMCYSSPICQNGVFDPVIDKCKVVASDLCPQGYAYEAGTNKCSMSPQCLQGGEYSQTYDKCIIEAEYNCPVGSYYNSERQRCEVKIECPEGQDYDPNLGGCNTGEWACPWGSNRPCVEYEGKLVCSPHDCETPSSGDEDEPPSGLEDDAEYKDDVCTGTIYIFTGKKMRCRPSGLSTGFHNCCDEAKGKLYDSFGSTAMGLVDGIKAIYAAMSLVKFANVLISADTISAATEAGGKIVSYSLYSGDKLLVTVAEKSVEGRAITHMLQTQALGVYHELQLGGGFRGIHLSPGEKLTSAMQGYAMSPQVIAAIVNIALTQAISDPVLSATVDLAYQLILLKAGIISGPMAVVAIALAVIKLAMALFTPRCDQQDILTSTYKESGYCHYVGSRCIKKILGKCVQKSKVYCCFNSKLARIIHEQGRPQLVTFGPDGGWGSAKSPNCRGFTPEEFQAIDFGRIDFSEYIEDVQRSVRQNIEPQLKSLFEGTMNQILKQ